MKKKLFAGILAAILLLGAVPAGALAGEAQRAADLLSAMYLVQGTNGDYRLNENATRAQAAVLLVRLSGMEKEAKGGASAMQDLPTWARADIMYAVAQGWLDSVNSKTFAPNDPVDANVWCAALLRMLGYSETAGDFAAERAAVFARQIGLVSVDYEGVLTRGQLFETMRDALTFRYRNTEETVADRLVNRGVCAQATVNALGLTARELTARQVADRYLSAVFCLELYNLDKDQKVSEESTGDASGFFISPDGLAVTNYHSIDGVAKAVVTLATGEKFPVERVIAYNPGIDFAIIRVSKTSVEGKKTSAFNCMEVAGTADLRNGDVVYAMGNPLGLGLAISAGVISATQKPVERYALPCVMSDATISRGSSGGALVNVYGQVVAITSGAYVYGNDMYLAVPADPILTADTSAQGWTLDEVIAREAEKKV